MPAGTIQKYTKEKKPRKRYTVIEENGIENINEEYYRDPQAMDVKNRYLKYFMDHNIELENLYEYRSREYKHRNNLAKNRYREVYLSLPPEVRREFHNFFDLRCEVQGSLNKVKKID